MKKIIITMMFCLMYGKSNEIHFKLPKKQLPLYLNINFKIHNNNPFNIVVNNKNNWLGKVKTDDRFEKFITIEHGIRAGLILIKNYQKINKKNTIYDIIYKFAPPSENNTEEYVKFVSFNLKVNKNEKINVNEHNTLMNLSRLILIREGYYLNNKQIYIIIKKFNL